MRLAVLAAAALLSAGPALAQTPPTPPAPAASPAANPADVASVDSIMAALYDVISGDPGPRDWDRFRGLFLPGATLGAAGHDAQGAFRTRLGGVDNYATRNGAYFMEHAFFERELGRKVERFGPIASVMSAYESRDAADAAQPIDRGVNAIHLVHDGQRWWIVSIYWTSETPENPIPADLLAAH
jgi:hypothetical protein